VGVFYCVFVGMMLVHMHPGEVTTLKQQGITLRDLFGASYGLLEQGQNWLRWSFDQTASSSLLRTPRDILKQRQMELHELVDCCHYLRLWPLPLRCCHGCNMPGIAMLLSAPFWSIGFGDLAGLSIAAVLAFARCSQLLKYIEARTWPELEIPNDRNRFGVCMAGGRKCVGDGAIKR
jgi:hypothetical protein